MSTLADDYEFFKPYSTAFNEDPVPTYLKLRDLPPVFYWAKSSAWVVTSYQHVTSVQRDSDFSTNIGHWERFHNDQAEQRSDLSIRLQGIFGSHGEDHIKIKKFIMGFFGERYIADIKPLIEELVLQRIAELENVEDFDVLNDFARRIPVAVISHILGIPTELFDTFYRYSNAFLELFSRSYSNSDFDSQSTQLENDIRDGIAMIRKLLEPGQLSQLRQDSLLVKIMEERSKGLLVSDEQLMAIIGELVAGGSDTTAMAIAYTVRFLLEHPSVRTTLIYHPGLWPSAIQEILRYESFIKLGIRYLVKDKELGGCQLKKGQMVLFMYGSAQRDPAIFPDPDRFIITRDNARSIAFGRSDHTCIGRNLAISETWAAVSLLLKKFPNLGLAEKPQFSLTNHVFREMLALRVNKYLTALDSTHSLRTA